MFHSLCLLWWCLSNVFSQSSAVFWSKLRTQIQRFQKSTTFLVSFGPQFAFTLARLANYPFIRYVYNLYSCSISKCPIYSKKLCVYPFGLLSCVASHVSFQWFPLDNLNIMFQQRLQWLRLWQQAVA